MTHHGITTGESALERLLEGNERYVLAKSKKWEGSQELRELYSFHQSPYAVVITCSDSRVIPESIFDTHIGEIFTIRIAGNVIGKMEMGSIEYAISHLECKLILLMGHSRCGAIKAAIDGESHGNIIKITEKIRKAIGDEKNPDRATKINVLYGLDRILNNESVVSMSDGLVIKGCIYHTRSGKVDLLDLNYKEQKGH